MQAYLPQPLSPQHAPAMGSGANMLDAWLADEARILAARDGGAGIGSFKPQDILPLDGLTQLRHMLEGKFPAPAISKTLGYILADVQAGLAVFQGEPKADYLNPLGTVHGGWYATLIDSALGCAVHTLMPAGRGYTTGELSVRYVRAVPLDVGRVRAIARVLHCGRQQATAEAQLVGPDGTLYAHGSTTCLVFEMRTPA